MADSSGAIADALPRLELESALQFAARRNDLLLDRVEDKVYGQLRAGWLASLTDRIRTRTYVPTHVEIVYVPKTRFTTRPEALMTLEDRLVFEALVSAAREKIERALVADDRLYWPRGGRTEKRWGEFERYPVENKPATSHVVMADVSGFYESIDHEVLRRSLLSATGWTDLSDAITSFLTALMCRKRGLPQGVEASDTLAALYLSPVDSELVATGLDYVRHGDDMRIASDNYNAGLSAAHLIETEVRKRDLLPNSSKLHVRRRDNYDGDLKDVDNAVTTLKEAWRESAADTILDRGEDFDVTELFEEISTNNLEFEELGWDWYRGDISMEELVEAIAPYLTADTLSVAQTLLANTMELRPGGTADRENQLSRDQFHSRFNFSLGTLRAADDESAVRYCAVLLVDYPDQTESVCRYLLAVATKAPEEIVRLVEDVLRADTFVLDWQHAWLFRVLTSLDASPSAYLFGKAEEIASDDRHGWIARVEAARVLAAFSKLQVGLYRQLWRNAPTVFRTDLLVAAHAASSASTDFATILRNARGDLLLDAVARHLGV